MNYILVAPAKMRDLLHHVSYLYAVIIVKGRKIAFMETFFDGSARARISPRSERSS